jgi:hypothetical protein
MQGRTKFALRAAIAAASVAVSALALAPASDAAPAETCLAAPKGASPQGSHWYYRLERPSMRKCWYLAEKGRAIAQRNAAQMVPPQQEPDEQTEAPTAPAANAPAAPAATAATPSANATAPAAETPAPVITTLVTRNVSNTDDVAQPSGAPVTAQPSVTANTLPSTAAEAASAPIQQPASEQQTPTAVAEQPVAQTAAAAAETANAPENTLSTPQLLLGAIALLGFLSSAVFFGMALMRRRNDVLSTWRETDALPFEPSPETAADEGPAFQPLRALDPIRQRDLDPIRQHDDVDEALRRMARRRRAA